MEKLKLVPVIHLEGGQAIIENKEEGERFLTDPVDLAVELDELGFEELLLIDDDGEDKGEFSAFDLLYEIAGYTSFEIIAKGGLRSFESIAKVFEAGASRCVLTSLSISDPEMITQLIDAYGSNSFIIEMDLMNDVLVYNNKKDSSDRMMEDLIELYSALGIDRFTLQTFDESANKSKPDPVFYDKVISAFPRIRLYSGEGIDNTDEFLEFENAGIKGMYLGDEFYTHADLFTGMKKYLSE